MQDIIAIIFSKIDTWLPILLSVCAFVFSLWQFFSEKGRYCKEATIHAFDQLEANDSIEYLFSLSETQINDIVFKHQNHDEKPEDINKWKRIGNALALLEHFAVGINNKVYDLSILNSMAGNKIISVFFNCEKLIEAKRNGFGKEKNYFEFEKMVKKIIKFRKKYAQSIPQKLHE